MQKTDGERRGLLPQLVTVDECPGDRFHCAVRDIPVGHVSRGRSTCGRGGEQVVQVAYDLTRIFPQLRDGPQGAIAQPLVVLRRHVEAPRSIGVPQKSWHGEPRHHGAPVGLAKREVVTDRDVHPSQELGLHRTQRLVQRAGGDLVVGGIDSDHGGEAFPEHDRPTALLGHGDHVHPVRREVRSPSPQNRDRVVVEPEAVGVGMRAHAFEPRLERGLGARLDHLLPPAGQGAGEITGRDHHMHLFGLQTSESLRGLFCRRGGEHLLGDQYDIVPLFRLRREALPRPRRIRVSQPAPPHVTHQRVVVQLVATGHPDAVA